MGKTILALDAERQFEAISTRLRTIKGRFILSINDVPEIRSAFRAPGFVLEEVELLYGKGQPASELIIALTQ